MIKRALIALLLLQASAIYADDSIMVNKHSVINSDSNLISVPRWADIPDTLSIRSILTQDEIDRLLKTPVKSAKQNQGIPMRSINQSLPVGTIQGTAGVSPSGAATYTIPIPVQPGRNGLEPQVSLVYNSQGGNGTAGWGWSLAATSSITRCGSNYYYDSAAKGIDWTTSDNLMLDGQRLILVSGSNLQNGAKYQLENDPATEITCRTAQPTGSLSRVGFTVRTRDGRTMNYGMESLKRLEYTETMTWLLGDVTDSYGNTMEYTYSGVSYPLISEISYAGKKIKFSYETRPDAISSYVAGALFTNSRRLTKITTYCNSYLKASEYVVSYTSDNYASRLNDITLYGHDNTHYNPTVATYGGSTSSSTYLINYSVQRDGRLLRYGDFDGDGCIDIISCPSRSTYYSFDIGMVFLYRTYSQPYFYYFGQIPLTEKFVDLQLGDVNGDGCCDAIRVTKKDDDVYRYDIFRSNGDGTFTLTSGFDDNGPASLVGDFNGDGRHEILVISSCKLYNHQGSCIASAGISSWGNSTMATYYPSLKFLADFNGNGKTDILVSGSSQCYVFELNGSTFQMLTGFGSYNLHSGYELDAGDFNGDGLTDILRQWDYGSGYSVYVSLSTGTGFTTPTYCLSVPNKAKVGRFNKDGKSDIFWYETESGGTNAVMKAGLFNGTGFDVQTVNTTMPVSQMTDANGDLYEVMDCDGDGRTDVCCTAANDQTYIASFGDPTPLKVTDITDGLGNSTTFGYSTIADGGICPEYAATNSFPLARIGSVLDVCSQMSQPYSNQAFQYKRPRVHMQGRGFMGFEEVTASDNLQNRAVTTTYGVNTTYYFPYVASQSVKTCSGSSISTTTYTNATRYTGTKRFVQYVSAQSTTDHLRSITHTSTTSIDAYGNPLTVTTNYGGGQTATVTNTYQNVMNTSNWVCGLPLTVTNVQTKSGNSWTDKLTYQYNSYYKPSKLTRYTGNGTLQVSQETYTYDTYGFPATVTAKAYNSSNSLTTTYAYDAQKCVLSQVTDPRSVVTTYTLDSYGQVTNKTVSKTGISGNLEDTDYTYDVMGTLTQESRQDGTTIATATSWSSTAGATYCATSTATGQPQVCTYYDTTGRELRREETRFDNTTLKQDSQYDTAGRLSRKSKPYKGNSANWIWYTYDSYGRLTQKLDYSLAKTTNIAYQGCTTETTADSITTSRTVNSKGQVIQVEDPAGTTTYAYRPDGQLSTITSTDNKTTTFGYDSYGRRTSVSDPSAGTYTFAYDSEGRLYTQTDADSRTETMTYNSYGDMATRQADGMTTTYSYDGAGRPTSEVSTNGTASYFTYDAMNRLYTQKENASSSVWLEKTYSYANGNVSSVAYESDKGSLGTESYTYANGHLTGITFGQQSIWTLNAENDMGLTSQATSGLVRSMSYDLAGRITWQQAVKPNTGTTVASYSYTYNNNTGNLTSRKDNLVSGSYEQFTYDAMNRLAGYGNKTVTYAANGNILTKSDVGSYAYNTTGKPYAVSDLTLASGSPSPGSQTVCYNMFNRPSSISIDGLSLLYTYNANHERVAMQIPGVGISVTRYYLGGNYERDVTSGVINANEKLYLGGDYYSAPAVYIKDGNSGQIYYILRDNLGSITHVVNSSGTVEQKLSYDAWGRLRNPSTLATYSSPSSEPIPFLGRGYCGHEHLFETGLINMNARLYDPLLGRFLSPDPYVQMPFYSQNFNRYSYCLNNPLRYNDLSGEGIGLDDAAIIIGCAFLGAYIGGTATNKGELNPLKWNYNMAETYLGIGFGGIIGGACGAAIAIPGSFTISFGAFTPWANASLNVSATAIGAGVSAAGYSLGKGTDWKFNLKWTTAGGGGGTTEYSPAALDQRVSDAYDNAVAEMGSRYAQAYYDNPYLETMYSISKGVTSFTHESSKILRPYFNEQLMTKRLISVTRVVGDAFKLEELYRDYYYDGGRIGFNFDKDLRRDIGESLGGFAGSSVSSIIGSSAATVLGIIGGCYIGLRIEQNAYEQYIRGWEPSNKGLYMNNYYDFFNNY